MGEKKDVTNAQQTHTEGHLKGIGTKTGESFQPKHPAAIGPKRMGFPQQCELQGFSDSNGLGAN